MRMGGCGLSRSFFKSVRVMVLIRWVLGSQIVEGHFADGLQAVRGKFIEGIGGGVPWG